MEKQADSSSNVSNDNQFQSQISNESIAAAATVNYENCPTRVTSQRISELNINSPKTNSNNNNNSNNSNSSSNYCSNYQANIKSKRNLFNWMKSASSSEETKVNKKLNAGEEREATSTSNNNRKYQETGNNASTESGPLNHPKRSSLSRARSQVADFTVGTLREFPGVQSLRHLWTKRINASEVETQTHSSNPTFNKSFDCLHVNASPTALTPTKTVDKTGNDNKTEKKLLIETKRSSSLYNLNLSHVHETPVKPNFFHPPQLDNESYEIYIDSFHREKDNFYKYKTAEQAAKHKDLKNFQHKFQNNKHVGKLIKSNGSQDISNDHYNEQIVKNKFPMVKIDQRGQHIHWATRDDILNKKMDLNPNSQQSNNDTHYHCNDNNNNNNNNKKMKSPSHLRNSLILNEEEDCRNEKMIINELKFLKQQQNHENNNHDTDHRDNDNGNVAADDNRRRLSTAEATSLTDQLDKPATDILRLLAKPNSSAEPEDKKLSVASRDKDSQKCKLNNNQQNMKSKTISLINTEAATEPTRTSFTSNLRASNASDSISIASNSTASNNSNGRSVKRNCSGSTNRKYSFKTHSHARSYHLPKKMSTNNNGSMVAKLTQQFNEIIQKDKKLLEEVKKKNGVLMTRHGHVYKVIPNTNSNTIERKLKASGSSASGGGGCGGGGEAAVGLNSQDPTSSLKRLSASEKSDKRNSLVLKTIKKFESNLIKTLDNDAQQNPEKINVRSVNSKGKPKPPTKSAEVLKKRNEIIHKNQIITTTEVNNSNDSPQNKLKRSPPPLQHHAHAHPYSHHHNHHHHHLQLKSPMLLEVVKEETKTLLEHDYDKSGDKLDPSQVKATNPSDHHLNNEVQLRTLEAVNTVILAKHKERLDNENTNNKNDNDNDNNNAGDNDDNDANDDDDDDDDEKSKIRKRKYAVIYEKIRLPFKTSPNKKATTSTTLTTTTTTSNTINNNSKTSPTHNKASRDNNNPNSQTEVESNSPKQSRHYQKFKEKKQKDNRDPSPLQSPRQKLHADIFGKETTKEKVYETLNEAFNRSHLTAEASSPESSKTKDFNNDYLMHTSPTATLLALTFESKDKDDDHDHEKNHLGLQSEIEVFAEAFNSKFHATKARSTSLSSSNTDFEQQILPNSSFIYQKCHTKTNLIVNHLQLNQAVNVALVNSIEGEQMIMEQKSLEFKQNQQLNRLIQFPKPTTASKEHETSSKKSERNEPIYEPIYTSQSLLRKKELPEPPKSYLYTKALKKTDKSGEHEEALESVTVSESPNNSNDLIIEDIYQSLDEVQITLASHKKDHKAAAAATTTTTTATASSSYSDYESIQDSSKEKTKTKVAIFDGYEEFGASLTAGATPATSATPITPTSGAAPILRNTNDELPELPKPKRRLPKSPEAVSRLSKSKESLLKSMITASASSINQKTDPLAHKQEHFASPTSFILRQTQPYSKSLEDEDDRHYYADEDENIYDTIKGSDLYESLQSTANMRLKNTLPNASDAISVTSNCYESISHYKTSPKASSSNYQSKSNSHCSLNNDTVGSSNSRSNSKTNLSTNAKGQGNSACPLPKSPSEKKSSLNSKRFAHINNAKTSNSSSARSRSSSSGSSLTISSDHKTNSLYGGSLTAISMGCPNRRLSAGSSFLIDSCPKSNSHSDLHSDSHRNIPENLKLYQYRHSIASSSENSDEWIDISDTEDNGTPKNFPPVKQKFIVVRSKAHRSPDWSKRVRDKRMNQRKTASVIDDDSDHYYESLSPLNTKSHSVSEVQYGSREMQMQHQSSGGKYGSSRYGSNLRASTRSRRAGGSSHVLGETLSDPYDSFDTDTDEIYETEENMKNHNDSGVETYNAKLPDPPASSKPPNGFKKKIQNFISKISPSSSSNKQTSSQGKIYETSQFFVESNVYENTPKAKSKSNTKSLKKTKASDLASGSSEAAIASSQNNDMYENTRLHILRPAPAPPSQSQAQAEAQTQQQIQATASEPKPSTASDKNLPTTNPTATSTTPPNTSSGHNDNASELPAGIPPPVIRPKNKASKSLRSRIRKSLVGSMDSKSTFYVDQSHHDSGELDSGFSEKASSGDLPTSNSTSTTQLPAASAANDALNFCTVRKNKKDAKTSALIMQRRRTTIGLRPHGPPPPPPANQHPVSNGKPAAPTTSWYAEYEVFKTTNGFGQEEGSGPTHAQPMGSMNCYAEAGLYQTTSGNSVASSSGSSGVSTGNEAGLGDGEGDNEDDEDLHLSMFSNEPLYQIYSAAKLESIARDMEEHDSSTDGYEEIGQNGFQKTKNTKSLKGGNKENPSQKRARPTALQLIEPKNGPSRTLWCEISEVINSGILPTLTARERALQEAKFEIITSEASYIKSLNLLRMHFMNNPSFRDTAILSAKDRRALFSYILPVHECSERLLVELESCWQDNIMLLGLSKRICEIAENHFHVYISFCEHQGRMDRTLRSLKLAKGPFSQQLDLLESSPTCCGLNLHSFLMLPMQRITRLRLLIDAVFSKLSANDDEYESWKLTMAIINNIVKQCNEAANRCEQAYEIERISKQLEFPPSIRPFPIAPLGAPAPGTKARYLVKKGELTHLVWRGDEAKLTFGKKFTKSTIFAFLFSDLIVLTKRRNDEQFIVFDYCARDLINISSGNSLPQLPTKDIGNAGKHLFLMTLLENHERKTIEMVLACPSISEQERWLQAMRPPEAETPGEKLYEAWDCPQVLVKHSYESTEPDVLNLEVGDVINVSRKMPDGWYQGERIRDGAVGWFPGNYTEEVNSAHVRSRNLKQRYRLLTFSSTYLESLKRK